MKIALRFFSIVLTASIVFANQPRLDNPFETKELFGSVGKGDVVWKGRGQRIQSDYSDFINGDFSNVYVADTNMPKEVGFMTLPWAEPWDLGFDWTLVINIKSNNSTTGTWNMKIIDKRGGYATANLPAIVQSEWMRLELKSSDFSPGYKQFDMSKIIAFQFQVAMQKGNKIWFDDVHFIRADESVLGVSDKTIEQYVAQEKASRTQRVKNAFIEANVSSSKTTLNPYFAKLYLNADVQYVNSKLYEIFTSKDPRIQMQYGINQLWHLSLDSILSRLYYTFGKKSDIFPGRLNQDTEVALLELIWKRNAERNDISLAKQSSWWIVAGESSDLASKVSALLSSQIFIGEAGYRDMVYSDSGKGGGYGYWFHKSKSESQGPQGEGVYKDWKQYKAVEHYYAYVDYFKKFFRERAKKGLLIENGSSVYAQYTLMSIYDIYSMCEDKQLKDMAGDFLNFYWSVWSQDQLAGFRGGAKVRDIGVVNREKDSDYIMAYFLMGCSGDVLGATLSQVLSDYHWPEIVWSLALDRQSMDEFEFVSRLPGEEENMLPRPLGNERTLMCDTESRFVRYSWVTPDYVMGCRMDHPTSVHSYLSNSGTKYGVMFSTIPEMAIFPWAIDVVDEKNWSLSSDSGNWRCVQDKGVMLFQQARSVISISPQWFPQKNQMNLPVGIYVNSKVNQVVEKEGWIFIREAGSYIAIRIVKSRFVADHRGSADWFDYQASDSPYANIDKKSYQWNNDRTIIKLIDMYSPVIFDSGSKKNFPTLESFIEHILDGQVALLKTVVPGWYMLRYTTANQVAEKVVFDFNASNSQIPAIDGKQIDYQPEKLYNSPYITSDYNSGVVLISKDEYSLELDFNQ